MAVLFACPRGHQWEGASGQEPSETCPVCGAAGETVVEGDTSPGAANDTPPPRPVASRDEHATLPPDEPVLPAQFGRYRIERRIGQGGMGSVYLAHDTQLDRPAAIKVPRFPRGAQNSLIERFLREARAAATLDHPNICSIYDVGQIDGVHYLSMAYVEGQSLARLIQDQHPLPQRAVADLVRKLALALEEAHAKGVVHRDLKPANIMLKTGYQPNYATFTDSSDGVQTFTVTVYDSNFQVLGREPVDIQGMSIEPTSWRLEWTPAADGLNDIAVSASDDKVGLGGAPVPEDQRPVPAPYWLQVKTDQPAQQMPMPPATTRTPGGDFADAAELAASTMAMADLQLGQAVFYRGGVKKGDSLRVLAAVEKPWFSGKNIALWESSAEYTVTLYDDDQVEVAKESLTVQGNLPDAQGPLEVEWQATLDGDVYVAVSSRRTSVESRIPAQPKPGRVALKIDKQGSNSADSPPAELKAAGGDTTGQ